MKKKLEDTPWYPMGKVPTLSSPPGCLLGVVENSRYWQPGMARGNPKELLRLNSVVNG